MRTFLPALLLVLAAVPARAGRWARPAAELKDLPYPKILLYTGDLGNKQHYGFEFLMTKRMSWKRLRFDTVLGLFAWDFRLREKVVDQASLDPERTVRSGAFGAKGGILVPTNRFIGLSWVAQFGLGLSTVQREPWFGRKQDSLMRRDVYLIETGWMWHWDHVAARLLYQRTSLPYFDDNWLFALGVTF